MSPSKLSDMRKQILSKEELADIVSCIMKCCTALSIDYKSLLGRDLSRPITEYRQLIYILLRQKRKLTYENVAVVFQRDHSTIVYGVQHIKGLLSYCELTQKRYKKLHHIFLTHFNKNKLS